MQVGGPGEDSTIGTPDQLHLSASPGEDGEIYAGGSGYSGGGDPGHDGGEDGGDGYYGGGKGSGLDVSSIHLLNFSMSPGARGKHSGNYGGGGGGGVLINGLGPNRTTTTVGEGYGGGRGYDSSSDDGPGLVLVEIIRRK